AVAALGALAGLSITGARACDNDRYACPIVSQPQEAPTAAARSPAQETPAAAARAGAGAQATGGDEGPAVAEAPPVRAAPPAAAANEVRVVDPNELNELDLAAVSGAPAGSSGSSWLSYLLMTLGGGLAAASTVRFLFFV